MSRALLLLSRLHCPISQKEVSLKQMRCVAVDIGPYNGQGLAAKAPHKTRPICSRSLVEDAFFQTR
jgi:hypothetical protein